MPVRQIGAVAEIRVGYQAPTGIKPSARGSHYLIQGKDFDAHDQLMTHSLLTFTPERKADLYSVSKGDIIFQARGTRHFSYYLEEKLRHTLVSASFYIIRVKDTGLLPAYLAWWLNQPPAQAGFQVHSAGGAISFVSKSALATMEITIPSLAAQELVIKVMDLWRQEQSLRASISVRRARLIRAASLKILQDKEKKL